MVEYVSNFLSGQRSTKILLFFFCYDINYAKIKIGKKTIASVLSSVLDFLIQNFVRCLSSFFFGKSNKERKLCINLFFIWRT